MEYIVDRLEDEYIVCEDQDGNIINIKQNIVEERVHEGDVLVSKDGKYIVDKTKTLNRKKYIEELVDDLWEN